MKADESRPLPAQGAALQPGDLVNDHEAAEILKVPVQTLRNWRHERRGPPFRKIGDRIVRYHIAELEAFTRGEGGAR